MPNFDKEIKGTIRTISHCEDDPDSGSWADTISHLSSDKEVMSAHAKMITLQKYFADNIKMPSKQKFRKEGTLPNGKDFYALKVGNIRAYGWFSNDNIFYISHYKYKNKGSLSQSDTDRVRSNWKVFEKK